MSRAPEIDRWEVVALEDGRDVFLALRYDVDAALRAKSEFANRWLMVGLVYRKRA